MKKLTLFLLISIHSIIFSQDEMHFMPYIQGELLIMVDDSKNLDDIIFENRYINSYQTDLAIINEVSAPTNIWLLSFNYTQISHVEMIKHLSKNPHVKIVQNNHYIQERSTVPNDPSFGSQWHHQQASDRDIDSDLAWDITTGGTTENGDIIVVCVIEGGGSNYSHPDLIANHWVNTEEIPDNDIDDDGNGYIDDYNGWNSGTNNDNIAGGNHGTGVSGMIGAVGNNSTNVVGANWNVKIMQVDMAGISESNVIAAYTYPLVMRKMYNASGGTEGAFVVATNASWGIDGGDPASAPLWCALYDTLGYHGILNCGATANNNVNIDVVGDLPTACDSDYMISVTATNNNDVRTFSGYGQTTIDLGAPGQNVVTTNGASGITSTSGTSFATPLTAGVIALLYSAPCSELADLAMSNPKGAAEFVRFALLEGVDPVANLTTETVTGGRLNAFNSLNIVIDNCATGICDATYETVAESAGCFGDCEGTITVNITDGGTFTYDIGDGPQSENVFTDLCKGDYSIFVTDGAACNKTLDVIVPGPISAISGNYFSINETFGNDGIINFSVSGGTSPYTILVTGPDGYSSNSTNNNGLISGTYNLFVTDANGCTFELTNIFLGSSVGIFENQITFEMYPNPAKNEINIKLNNTQEQNIFILFDNLGREVLRTNLNNDINTIQISDLSQGLYLFEIINEKGGKSKGKLIVE